MKCVRKLVVVDAEQFNGVDKLEGMSRTESTDSFGYKASWLGVNGERGFQKAMQGDWVVRQEGKSAVLLSDEAFREQYGELLKTLGLAAEEIKT